MHFLISTLLATANAAAPAVESTADGGLKLSGSTIAFVEGSGTLTIGDMAAMQDKLNQPDGPCRKGQMASDADQHNMTRAQADEYCVGRYQCAGYSIQAPFSTCPSKSNTTIFVVHFSDAWGARRINGDANWSSWVVPGARPPPPPPPTPPIPPNPCPDDVTNSARTKTPLYFILLQLFFKLN